MSPARQPQVLNGTENAFVDLLDEWSVGPRSAGMRQGSGAGVDVTLTHPLRHLSGND